MPSSSASIAVSELPLFPLPEVVLFPGQVLPLHIFEFRYRIMAHTILAGDRRFGVLAVDPQTGAIAQVGSCAEILQYQRLPDDRWKIASIGQQRFRLLDLVREKPYRVGLVEWLDDDTPEDNLASLAAEVQTLLRDVVRLSGKLTDRNIELPDDLPTLPRELSFWIAAQFYGIASEQQSLLELQDTAERLRREAEILTATRSQLAARTVLKDALQ